MTEASNVWEQNVEMWNKMSSAYMDTMFKTAETAMAQSTAFQKQINQAASTAASAQLDATLSAIKSLEQQVEALAEKLEQLTQGNA
jgi:hypothetical protein